MTQNFDTNSTNERDNTSKKLTVPTKTEAAHIFDITDASHESSISCQAEAPSHTDKKTTDTLASKLIQTEEQPGSTNTQHVSDSSPTEERLTKTNIKQESISSQTEEPFYDFELFKTSSITILQESFVTAFDKINDSIRTMRINRTEEDEMKQRIMLLTKENERLKEAKKTATQDMTKAKVACQSCSESAVKIEKMNKILATEKEKSQQSLHNFTVMKENQVTKMEADAGLLKHQLELTERKNKIYEQEISSLEKRIEAKNDSITKLETQKSDMLNKITNLEDEIMSWKLHECRAESEAVFEKVKGKNHKLTEEDSICNLTRETSNKGTEESSKSQKTAREPETDDCNASPSKLSTTDDSLKQRKDPKKLQVQIVGTSNIKFISPEYIGEKEFEVSKVTKYTLDETQTFIEGLTPTDRHDAFILHSLCNEVGVKSPEECTNHMKRILETVTNKNKKAKVIVSLGLPRKNKDLNRGIEKTNILIKEMTSEMRNVFICDNSNLFYRGEAQKGILNEDGLHLARAGTRKLGRNMKEALWGTFDIPIIVRYEPNNDSQGNKQNEQYKDLQEGERQSRKTRDWDRRAHNSYSAQESGRQTHGNSADEDRRAHRNYDAWDRETRSQYNHSTWDNGRRSLNYDTQDNKGRSHDYNGVRGGIRRSHDNNYWDNDRDFNNSWKRDEILGSYGKNGARDMEWSSPHYNGSRGGERRSHYYQDEGGRSHSSYGSKDRDYWAQNRLLGGDQDRFNFQDSSYGNYRY